jgi:hypothetical protein
MEVCSVRERRRRQQSGRKEALEGRQGVAVRTLGEERREVRLVSKEVEFG